MGRRSSLLGLLCVAAALWGGRADALEPVDTFGSNPGALEMFWYLPATLQEPAPAVLLLHGCTQSAAAYDAETGWEDLADQHGFALVVAQQTSANNSNGCFNWFEPGDIARGSGEAASLAQMVEHLQAEVDVDPAQVFVTGLSAGGAMTAVMLATYPDLFAGGAIVAGIPYACATSMIDAFTCMSPGQDMTPGQWGDLVRGASTHTGPWPLVSVWHGDADWTVLPANALESVEQWTDVHGADAVADVEEAGAGYVRHAFGAADGSVVVERFIVSGMGHGVPVDPAGGCGAAGSFVLDVGVCSSEHIASFWGLDGSEPDVVGDDDDDLVDDDDVGDDDDLVDDDDTGDVGDLVGFSETFSDLDGDADDYDNPGWSATGFVSDAANHSPVPATSGSVLGGATSGADCETTPGAAALWRTVTLGSQPSLSYQRMLELQAAVNINSEAAFRVLVDGAVVDQEEVVFAQHSESAWTERVVDLADFADAEVELRFELHALSTVCIEVTADAWLDDVQLVELGEDPGDDDDGADDDDVGDDDDAGDDDDSSDDDDAEDDDDASSDDDDVSDDDAPPEADSDGAGCGCAVQPVASPTWAWALSLVILAWRRRGR